MRTVFVLILLLGGTACRNTQEQQEDPVTKEDSKPRIEVGAAQVFAQDVSVTPELFGRLRPMNVAEIRPQVTGIILERRFREGSFVSEGEELYRIDPARYEAALKLAEGQLARAQANVYASGKLLRRFERLIKVNAISRQEYDDARARNLEHEAAVKIAEAQVENARINLTYTKVLAPISGYIGKTEVTKGALVTANQPEALAVIRALDPLYVDFSLPGQVALGLRKELIQGVGAKSGQKLGLRIQLDQTNETYPYRGHLEARELSAEEATGSVALRGVVPNPDLLLLPGMFVRARVEELGQERKLLVPQAAVDRDQNGDPHVWLIGEGGVVERRRIETGIMAGTHWSVERGLEAGEVVAVDNLSKLEAGAVVRARDAEAPAQSQQEE